VRQIGASCCLGPFGRALVPPQRPGKRARPEASGVAAPVDDEEVRRFGAAAAAMKWDDASTRAWVSSTVRRLSRRIQAAKPGSASLEASLGEATTPPLHVLLPRWSAPLSFSGTADPGEPGRAGAARGGPAGGVERLVTGSRLESASGAHPAVGFHGEEGAPGLGWWGVIAPPRPPSPPPQQARAERRGAEAGRAPRWEGLRGGAAGPPHRHVWQAHQPPPQQQPGWDGPPGAVRGPPRPPPQPPFANGRAPPRHAPWQARGQPFRGHPGGGLRAQNGPQHYGRPRR